MAASPPIDDDRHAPDGRQGQAEGDSDMNFEKYTERARGFVQSAQSLWPCARATSNSPPNIC